MIRPRDVSAVPRGGQWTYTDPDTGYVIRHPYYNVLLRFAKEFRKANNLPIGLQFEEQFQAIICAANPVACMDYEPPTLASKAAKLANALVKWAASGFKVRSEVEVAVIQELCRNCPEYGGENGLLRVVCKKCGCSRKKLYLATEHCPLNPPKW